VKTILLALLLCASFVLAQDNQSTAASGKSKDANGQVTLQGCVTRANGDYILIKQDPAITYELQASGKIKLRSYLGQRVEVTGQESTSMPTSTDTTMRTGSPSPLTITVKAIRTLDKECSAR